MTELVRYEAARRALAEAVAVDDVTEIRSKAEAMRIYAQQAGDKELEIKAAQIRFRAEIRLGELLIAAKDAGQIREGRPKNRADKEQFAAIDGGALEAAEAAFAEYREASPFRVTLEQAGIDRKLSARAQRMASMPAAELEQALARHAEEMRAGKPRVAMDLLKVGAEEKGRAHRRDLAAALSQHSVQLPEGRRYPANYIDCPWERKGGIGDRAYENHYPTMTWPEILAFLRKARDTLLPDAWSFFWIPRAHLLALVEVESEVEVAATGEMVVAKVMMPLAWACAQALGMDSYSTCFVWTKTDEDHPDVSGSGLIAWDQDELLLLFKRGRGLPKPSGAEKFGSNHRERPREHSRKPDHYRRMIASMVGCDSAGHPLPVLEMFARVDAEHPLPPNWDACGNQAGAAPVVIDSSFIGEAATDENAAAPGRDTTGAAAPFFSFAEEMPSAGETVTAAAEATSAGASAAAAVTDIPAFLPDPPPAFPPTEFSDLQLFVELAKGDQVAAIAPAYLTRGLVVAWCGGWKLTGAGRVRLDVLLRERAEREAVFARHLSEDELIEWRALAAVAGREKIDRELERDLIGKGYVDDFAADRGVIGLTASGQKWLASIESHVERTEGIASATLVADVIAPRQLSLIDDALQGGE